ncbi:response regulator [Dankookia rubra]|nr:response regulator [Dankookia rubra]
MPRRVALVDDAPGFAAGLAAFPGANGCTVRLHGSRAGFPGALTAERPELVILDHRLRGGTGPGVRRRRREASDLPCSRLTGAAGEVDRVPSLEPGAGHHVGKTASRASCRRGPARPRGRGGWTRGCATRSARRAGASA